MLEPGDNFGSIWSLDCYWAYLEPLLNMVLAGLVFCVVVCLRTDFGCLSPCLCGGSG